MNKLFDNIFISKEYFFLKYLSSSNKFFSINIFIFSGTYELIILTLSVNARCCILFKIFCENEDSDNYVSHLIDPSRNLCLVISKRPKLLILPICILALSFLILSLIFFSTILLL